MSTWPTARLGDLVEVRRQVVDPGACPAERFSHYSIPAFDNDQTPSVELGESILSDKLSVGGGWILFSRLNPRISRVWQVDQGEAYRRVASTEFVPLVVGRRLDADFLVVALKSPMIRDQLVGQTAAATKSRERLDVADLLEVHLPLPPLDEQRRIAARLREQLALQGSLADHLRADQRAIDELEERLLKQAATIVSSTPTASIGDLTDSPPSPSVKSDGEAAVIAVTSGCLTGAGWSDAGLKTARMRPADLARGTLEPGEVLVSRSNTEELVGRAAVFPGSAGPIVATDLVFRLRAVPDRLMPAYLAIQLQVMQLGGYWHDRSSGASSTMKKITRTQLNAAVIPLPPLDEQRRIAARLRERLAEIGRAKVALEALRAATDTLPAALLREVFNSGRAPIEQP